MSFRAAIDVETGAGRTPWAVVATRRGGPSVLRTTASFIPEPREGQVLIEVGAAGVAFGDVMLREGLRDDAKPPAVPGYDVAGRVLAIGPDGSVDSAIPRLVVGLTGTC